MKEFFKHDHNSRNDPKLIILQSRHGFAGVGLYWSLIEMMHEQCGCINRALLHEMLGIMHRTYRHHDEERDPTEMLATMVELGLIYESPEGDVGSQRVERNLAEYKADSERAAKAARARWNAKQMHPHKSSNAKSMPEEEEEEEEEEKRKSRGVVFTPPTLEEAELLMQSRGLPPEEAERFIAYYDSQGWVKANGRKVHSWQSLVAAWAMKYKQDKLTEQHIPTKDEAQAFAVDKWPTLPDGTSPQQRFAAEYYLRYQQQGWKLPNGLAITDWKAGMIKYVMEAMQKVPV